MHCLLQWIGTASSKQQCPMDRRPWGECSFLVDLSKANHLSQSLQSGKWTDGLPYCINRALLPCIHTHPIFALYAKCLHGSARITYGVSTAFVSRTAFRTLLRGRSYAVGRIVYTLNGPGWLHHVFPYETAICKVLCQPLSEHNSMDTHLVRHFPVTAMLPPPNPLRRQS